MTRSDSAATARAVEAGEETGAGGEGDSPKKKTRPASAFFRTSLGGGDSPASSSNGALPPTSSFSSASHALSSSLSSNSSTSVLSSSTSGGGGSGVGPRKSGGQLWESVSSVFGFGSTSNPSSSSSTPQNMKPLMLSDAAASARKLDPAEEIDEDEDDRRERERIRNEMLQAGFEPPPASQALAHRPSLSSRPSYSSSSGSPSLAAAAPASPRTLEAQRLASLARLSQQETAAKADLQQGKASGFTDPPAKRFSAGRMERRHSSGRSLSYRTSSGGSSLVGEEGLGLGLALEEKEEEGKEGGAAGGAAGGADEGKLGKAFKRLSTAWTSPAMQ
jgi:hypothetical protein